MPLGMTIGDLARSAGVANSTIRYYERSGLLRAAGRTEGNYRYFEPSAVERLQFIRAAQSSGLSLDDIRMLLEFRDGVMSPCREVQSVIEARLREVSAQMKHLRHTQRVLEGFRVACRSRRGRGCPTLDRLGRPTKRS